MEALKQPTFKDSIIVPTGELKVVETRVERLNDGEPGSQINATVIFEDECGLRYKIRGYGGGPVAGALEPLELPTNIHATYALQGKAKPGDGPYQWRERVNVVANSYEEALQKHCAEYSWRKPENFELIGVYAPPAN